MSPYTFCHAVAYVVYLMSTSPVLTDSCALTCVLSIGRTYENGARISAQHNALVQEVVVHHPKYTEKAGCGIAYIKVDKHPNFPDSRCFWIVREDGTETDFSYHKCLKEKAAKEFPDFVEKYDTTYTGKSRGPAAAAPPPPPPPANL
jgi:hypothetical protein